MAEFVCSVEWDWPIAADIPFDDLLTAKAVAAALELAGKQRRVPSYVKLYGRERRTLKRILRTHKSQQRDVLRARIVLLAAEGLDNSKIASQLNCDVQTVRKWRELFVFKRLIGLKDAKRSGRPPIYTSETRHELFAMVVSTPPDPYARWTIDLLCDELIRRNVVPSISRETLSYWLRTAELKPHRVRSWLNSKDPNFYAKMRRIVDLYINPPKDGVVISVDELTGVQALERKYPTKTTKRGVRLVEFEYIRHGTIKMIASFVVHSGQVTAKFVDSNNSDAFIDFLDALQCAHPTGKIYLILDNGSSHRSKKTTSYLAKHPRLVPVYTPTHASWLNQIEIWFSALKRKSIYGVSYTSKEELQARILRYIEHHNLALARPYKWTYTGQPLSA